MEAPAFPCMSLCGSLALPNMATMFAYSAVSATPMYVYSIKGPDLYLRRSLCKETVTKMTRFHWNIRCRKAGNVFVAHNVGKKQVPPCMMSLRFMSISHIRVERVFLPPCSRVMYVLEVCTSVCVCEEIKMPALHLFECFTTIAHSRYIHLLKWHGVTSTRSRCVLPRSVNINEELLAGRERRREWGSERPPVLQWDYHLKIPPLRSIGTFL